MNTKGAELPLNFIVIAAIAMLVLIVVAMFFFGGFKTQALDSQTAANSCSAKCFAKQRIAVDELKIDGIKTMDSSYCAPQEIKGLGTTTCAGLSPCTLTFSNGECKVSCATGEPSCS